jgi:predicted ATPase
VAIFTGSFTLDTAVAVVEEEGVSQNDIAEALESLVDKSMVEAGINTQQTSYRLLDTTRTYGLEKLLNSGEHDAIATRHSNFLSKLLEERAISTCLKPNRLRWAQELLTTHSAILA